MRTLRTTGSPLLLLALCAAWPVPAPAAPQSPGWTYTVHLDEALTRMDVRICFQRFLPKRLTLVPGASQAPFDFDAGGADGVTLVAGPDGVSVVPRGLRPGGCVAYRVDLARLAKRPGGRRRIYRVGRDLVAAPGLLLLRPALWPRDARVEIAFDLAPGVRPAVPWPRTGEGHRYGLDASALTLRGLVAFGRFPENRLDVAGTRMDIALLDAPCRATREGIRTWLRAAASAVADLYGGFPLPRVTVLVQPVPARRPAVVFGQALRAGGGLVHLLLAAAATDGELPGEWVAVHEMTHLGMPWTHDAEAWLQEGFVTYYQEVLRARAGFLTEQEGWQQLHEGFERGRSSGGQRTLAAESRTMGRNHAYWRVYWAGAAVALLLDLEIRRRWPGTRSLDDVMRMLHRRIRTAGAPSTGVDLLRAVDRWLGQPLCGPVAQTCLESAAFPDLGPAYAALGLREVDGRIVYEPGASQAADRAGIMRPGGR